jgi:hypothetical protein
LSKEIVPALKYNTNLRILDDCDFEKVKDSESFHKPHSKRIASLDFQRGIAIWLVTFLHSFERLYDYSWVKEDPEAVLKVPAPVLVAGLFVGFFACWNAYFLLISSTVNSYASARKRYQTNKQLVKIFKKQLLTGIGIIFAGMLTVGFGFSGYIDNSIQTGNWNDFSVIYKNQFRMSTLHMIGYSLVINSVIRLVLLRNNGQRKFRRNMLVYAVLALAVIIASPFIHNWVDNMPWKLPENPPLDLRDATTWPNEYFQGENASPKAFFLAILAGDMEPLFPYLATSFVGSMIGLSLAREKPIRKFPLVGGFAGVTFMVLGAIFLSQGFFVPSNGRPALGNYFLMLGGQMCAIMLSLALVEYRGRSEKFARRGIVKHCRLWGMISLSVFSLGIIELFPKWVLSKVLTVLFEPVNLVQKSVFGFGKEYLAILVSVYVICFFELVIYLWSKINFKYSLEWYIIKVASAGSQIKSSRLNVPMMIYNTNYVNYKLRLQANDITKSIETEAFEKFAMPKLKV